TLPATADDTLMLAGDERASGEAPVRARRRAWFPEHDDYLDTAIHDRRDLRPGMHLAGPAIVEDPEATIVVPPRMRASVSKSGHIVIETGNDAEPARSERA
ncbi:MAG: hypothetical protein KDK91_16940, partial [Gammaproteobacteria bacterium]|nr:hypothetical protein [Gammaproteobacteria bacterium]